MGSNQISDSDVSLRLCPYLSFQFNYNIAEKKNMKVNMLQFKFILRQDNCSMS